MPGNVRSQGKVGCQNRSGAGFSVGEFSKRGPSRWKPTSHQTGAAFKCSVKRSCGAVGSAPTSAAYR
jgi:hypothetical protein